MLFEARAQHSVGSTANIQLTGRAGRHRTCWTKLQLLGHRGTKPTSTQQGVQPSLGLASGCLGSIPQVFLQQEMALPGSPVVM